MYKLSVFITFLLCASSPLHAQLLYGEQGRRISTSFSQEEIYTYSHEDKLVFVTDATDREGNWSRAVQEVDVEGKLRWSSGPQFLPVVSERPTIHYGDYTGFEEDGRGGFHIGYYSPSDTNLSELNVQHFDRNLSPTYTKENISTGVFSNQMIFPVIISSKNGSAFVMKDASKERDINRRNLLYIDPEGAIQFENDLGENLQQIHAISDNNGNCWVIACKRWFEKGNSNQILTFNLIDTLGNYLLPEYGKFLIFEHDVQRNQLCGTLNGGFFYVSSTENRNLIQYITPDGRLKSPNWESNLTTKLPPRVAVTIPDDKDEACYVITWLEDIRVTKLMAGNKSKIEWSKYLTDTGLSAGSIFGEPFERAVYSVPQKLDNGIM